MKVYSCSLIMFKSCFNTIRNHSQVSLHSLFTTAYTIGNKLLLGSTPIGSRVVIRRSHGSRISISLKDPMLSSLYAISIPYIYLMWSIYLSLFIQPPLLQIDQKESWKRRFGFRACLDWNLCVIIWFHFAAYKNDFAMKRGVQE